MLVGLCKIITRFFPIWVVVFSLYAFYVPASFKSIGFMVTYLLGFVMLTMGLTMSVDDFKLVFSRPKDVIWGVLLRYFIMPFVAFGVSKVMNLSPELAAGLILVGCCPSGVASNVMTFLGKGDTALSVTVSSVNTILAPIITPFMFLMLAGTIVPIQASVLFLDIVKIVLIPVILGLVIRAMFTRFADNVAKYLPALSSVSIIIIIMVIVALSAAKLATVAGIAFIAVMLHNAFGLAFGYGGAKKVAGMEEKKARAITFEIGMENSGLAAALAIAHLDPIAAIPGAIFSVWHNLTGSALASYWAGKTDKEEKVTHSN